MIGQVVIGENTNIWFNTVIRGDVNLISIGSSTNIQDNCTIHVTHNTGPTKIGSHITIGHGCTLHACTVEDYSLIGMNTTILDQSIVPDHCMIGAGSLVSSKCELEPGFLHFGRPCKKIRPLKKAEMDYLEQSAKNYVRTARTYAEAGVGTIVSRCGDEES